MKSNIKKNIVLFILLIILVFMIINNNDIMHVSILALEVWKKNIFPILFPFFILSDLLINYGLIELLGNIFKKPMEYIFHFNKPSVFIFFISMFAGFPSSSKYTAKMLREGTIDIECANRIITCSHFSNPLFVLGTVQSLINNHKMCIKILICHYLGNFIIAFLSRKKRHIDNNILENIKKQSFTDCFTNSIINNTNTLLFILGTITIFFILNTIVAKYITSSSFLSIFISGILEMTQGIRNVSLSNLDIMIKSLLITFFISFGGLCVHIQTIGMISNTPISYKKFLKSRILHAFISCVLIYLVNLLSLQ